MVKQKSRSQAPRIGRPSLAGKVSPGERSPLVGVRLAPDTLKVVDALARRVSVKRSEMVRRLMEAGLEVALAAKSDDENPEWTLEDFKRAKRVWEIPELAHLAKRKRKSHRGN